MLTHATRDVCAECHTFLAIFALRQLLDGIFCTICWCGGRYFIVILVAHACRLNTEIRMYLHIRFFVVYTEVITLLNVHF